MQQGLHVGARGGDDVQRHAGHLEMHIGHREVAHGAWEVTCKTREVAVIVFIEVVVAIVPHKEVVLEGDVKEVTSKGGVTRERSADDGGGGTP